MKAKKVKITEEQFRREYTRAVKALYGLEFNDLEISDAHIKDCAERGVLAEREALKQGKKYRLTRIDETTLEHIWKQH